MDFLKNLGTIAVSLIVGLMIASYFNDPKNPSPISAVLNAFGSLKATLINLPKSESTQDNQKEGKPTPGISMSNAEISEAQKYFNNLAGIDPSQKDKSKEAAEKKEKEEKADPKAPPIPTSLFAIKKRDSASNEGADHGAVYALGTSPYGPPPFVKHKIFEKGSMLKIDNDPLTPEDKEQGHLTPYQKPSYSLPLLKNSIQNVTLPTLDPKNTFTIQLGAFDSEEEALRLKKQLVEKGHDVHVYKDKTHPNHRWFYVRLKAMMTEDEAYRYKKDIAKDASLFPLIVLVEDDIDT
jgi:hypothetical protein